MTKRSAKSALRGAANIAALIGMTIGPAAFGQTTQDQDFAPRVSGNVSAAQQSAVLPSAGAYEPDQLNARDLVQPRSADGETAEAIREERRDRDVAATRLVKPNEFEQLASDVVGKPLRRFGSSLLVPNARDFTAPPTTAIPPDYRLNVGDELVVSLAGSVDAVNLRLVVDSEGRVFLPRIGPISVGGVRYGDVRGLVASQVSRFYRDYQLDVSVGHLHGITIYVTGFAATPGSYTVSSLSTLVNAVLAAGGPSTGGSFRSIQLRRAGALVSDFDLYDLLLRGDTHGDAVLQNGDVIYIAPVGAQVAAIGSVNNEAVFETKPNDTLNDVIAYAGGTNTLADARRLLLLDPLHRAPGGWEEVPASQAQSRPVKPGEIIDVLSSAGLARSVNEQYALVTISGEVAKPGRYYVRPGAHLGEVVAQAGGLTDKAFVYASVITRESVRLQQQTSFDRALKDIELSLTAQPVTSVSEAGRLQEAYLSTVRSFVAQLRAREPSGRLVFDLPVTATALPEDLAIEHKDTIYVPPRPVTIGVFGAVSAPASFIYSSATTIGDYIGRAGGVLKFGARSEIFVVRANGTVLGPHRGGSHGGRVSRQPALPGDLVFVPLNTTRGEAWAKVRDFASVLSGGALSAALVATAVR